MSTAVLLRRAAIKAASLQTLAISAPANPGVCADNSLGSTPGANFTGFKCTLNIASRPIISGLSIEIVRSNRPGLKSAGSNTSGRFVAAKMIIPESVAKPSISTNNEFKVFSLSSLEPGI